MVNNPDFKKYLVDPILNFHEILQYSPLHSIHYDLYWLKSGTVRDMEEVAFGFQPPDIYERYCLENLYTIKNSVIPHLKSLMPYKVSSKILEIIVEGFERNSFITSNILLITVIESLVRVFAKHVYKNQHQELNEITVNSKIDNYQSLETVITKIDWKDDIPINVYEAHLLSKIIDDPSLQKATDFLVNQKLASDKWEAAIRIQLFKIKEIWNDPFLDEKSKNLQLF